MERKKKTLNNMVFLWFFVEKSFLNKKGTLAALKYEAISGLRSFTSKKIDQQGCLMSERQIWKFRPALVYANIHNFFCLKWAPLEFLLKDIKP